MKRIFIFSLIIAMLLVLFAACQATPDDPVVIQKDLEQMMEKAIGDETSNDADVSESSDTGDSEMAALAEKLGVPERFTISLENAKHNVSITADAQIVLPQPDKMPTAKVQMGRIEQAAADKILRLFIGDNPFYESSKAIQTKQDIERQLKILYEMRDGTRPLDIEGPDTQNTMEDLNKIIFKIEQRLEAAPDETELPPASRTYQATEFLPEVIDGISRTRELMAVNA